MVRRTLGDTAYGVFIAELVNNCVRDVPSGLAIDMNLLMQMCRAEPKSAQVALQWFAQDLTKLLGGQPVEAASGDVQNVRLLVASIYLGYCGAREHVVTPPEIEWIVEAYPVVLAAVDFVLADQQRRRGDTTAG